MSDLPAVLDVTQMEFDRNGVKGFVWPLSRDEMIGMRDAVMPQLVRVARGGEGVDHEHAELLSVVFCNFLSECMELFQAQAMTRRFGEMGLDMMMPRGSRFMSALTTGAEFLPSPLLARLKLGMPDERNRFRRAGGRLRKHLDLNGVTIAHLRPFHPERDIVTLQAVEPVLRRHAQTVPDFVRYIGSWEWIEPLDDESVDRAAQEISNGKTIPAAVHVIERGFAAGNERLHPRVAAYLQGWLADGMAAAQCHISALLERPNRVPRRLWVGTAGHARTRIVQHATRRMGGTVTGHDHGAGIGHLASPQPTIAEFESCDTFVTSKVAQASGLRKGLREDLLIPDRPPTIEVVPPVPVNGRREFASPVSAGQRDQPVRAVMYYESLYRGERLNFMVQLPDMVAVDWEARLFAHLDQWGYEGLHKPHPGSVGLPTGLAERFGGRTLTQPFEEVMDQADVFVLSNSQSTTLAPVLASNKGVVFVDVGRVKFWPEAYEMFTRRCAVVKGWLDDENRIQVHWDQLHTAIEESVHLTDDSFLTSYLDLEA